MIQMNDQQCPSWETLPYFNGADEPFNSSYLSEMTTLTPAGL